LQQPGTAKDSPRKIVINRCIAEKTGPARFYINKGGLSSSALPPAAGALEEHVTYPHCRTWGENTELDRVVDLEAVSIDDLVEGGSVPAPDVLSMDVQGAEFAILKGARQTIRKSVLGVISEVEFSELYEKQGLFHDQMGFLADMNFRLADVLNVQYFHPGPAIGSGFLTVGEAIFLRRMNLIVGEPGRPDLFISLLKLAAISFGLGRYSYAHQIYHELAERHARQLVEVAGHPFDTKLSKLHAYVQENIDQYLRDNEFFVRGGAPNGYLRPGHGNIDWRTAVKVPLELWDPLTFGGGGAAELTRHSETVAMTEESERETQFLRWHQTQSGADNPIFCHSLSRLDALLGQELALSFLARSGTESEIDIEICLKINSAQSTGASLPPFSILRARVGNTWQQFRAAGTVAPLPDISTSSATIGAGSLEIRVMLPSGWTGFVDFARPTLWLPRAAAMGL
jgi:FkbM family methyltransferase